MRVIYLTVILTIIFTGCSTNKVIVQPKTKVIKKAPIMVIQEPEIQEPQELKIDNNSNIAIIFSSKIIGRYAINATNSVMNYLISKDKNFNLKAYDMANEEIGQIQNAFDKAHSQNITKVIALLTNNGASNLPQIQNIDSFRVYLPLIKKDNLSLSLKSVYYGSIDYSKQFDKLFEFANPKIIEFFDNSNMGHKLSQLVKTKNINLLYSKEIGGNNKEYFDYLKRRVNKINNASLIINMPVVKSSIMLSQINANEIVLSNILSTQLNYTPSLFALTQTEDRQNMIIANSIGEIDDKLIEYNLILENDIVYNWVNYATIVGTQYLIDGDISSFKGVAMEENQIIYDTNLYYITDYAFKKIDF